MQTPKTETAAVAASKPDPFNLDTLNSMSLAELRQAWLALGEGEPPQLPEHLLRLLLAYRLQEQWHGSLPARVARKLDRLAKGEGKESPRPVSNRPGPGTRLIREWNGRTISVLVRDDHFVWEERQYSSLSQIAREVTGAHWSGPRFFGLARHG